MSTIVAASRACTKCKVEHPRMPEFFPSNRRMKDGMSSWCHGCHRDAARRRYWANPEPVRDRARDWGRANPERNRQRVASWSHQNAERKSALDREWRAKNSERKKENDRRWRDNNLERDRLNRRLREARRRERKRNAPGYATQKQVMDRVAYYGWKCWVCRGPFEQIDHVVPLALGGSGWPANLRPICAFCNQSKGARRPLDFIRRRVP